MSGPKRKEGRAAALAAVYRETANPLYAWFCIREIAAGRFTEPVPADVASYLDWAAVRIGEIERDDKLTAPQKSRAVAGALGLTGSGSSNPFTRFRRDRDDAKAYNNAGMLLFLQRVGGKRPTQKAVLAGVKGMAASTAKARLKNGERLHKLWESFFPRGRQSD